MIEKLSWLGLAVALAAYFGVKIFGGGDTIDFKYIWLAGELWSEGTNPYTEVYVARGEAAFQGLNPPTFWVYPPNWWPIATGMAIFPYELSGTIWRLFSLACLILGCLVVSRAMRAARPDLPVWYDMAFLVLTASLSATAITLSLGQTSMMIFLGICLFVAALLQSNRGMMAAALVILALKPTLGLVMAVALFPGRFWWPAILGAGAVTLAMVLPGVLQHGIGPVFGNMLERLAEYGQVDVNKPPEMTGLRHLADRVAGIELGTFICLGLGLAASFVGGLWLRNAGQGPAHRAAIAFVLISAAFFVPLHTYDLIFVTLVVLLTAGLPILWHGLCILGVLALWRANNVEALAGLTVPETIYFQGSLLSSVALLGLVLVLAIFALRANLGAGRRLEE